MYRILKMIFCWKNNIFIKLWIIQEKYIFFTCILRFITMTQQFYYIEPFLCLPEKNCWILLVVFFGHELQCFHKIKYDTKYIRFFLQFYIYFEDLSILWFEIFKYSGCLFKELRYFHKTVNNTGKNTIVTTTRYLSQCSMGFTILKYAHIWVW